MRRRRPTPFHCADSRWIITATSCADVPVASEPNSAIRACTSGRRVMRTISALSRATISAGVCAHPGGHMRVQGRQLRDQARFIAAELDGD